MKSPTVAVILCLAIAMGGSLSCRSPGEVVAAAEEAAEVEPFFGYFESLRPEGLYLFANIKDKATFDRDPGMLRFRKYIDRTGVRVYIHAPVPRGPGPTEAPTSKPATRPTTGPATQPDTRPTSSAAAAPATLPALTQQEQEALAQAELMVERIARGFELSRDTVLFLQSDPDAPPVAARLPELNPDSDDESTPK